MKTDIYNLIILDESGSMNCVRQQTINGCNETINTIISAQKQFAETQNHYVSIYAFQSNDAVPSHYIVKNVPAEHAQHISDKDYEPWGGTPLYDAIGSTLVDMKVATKGSKLAIGSVTIITDGEENSSRSYSLPKVARMIEELKEMGWNFNFIGANIDVKKAASALNIDNTLEFHQDEEGTRKMFVCESRSRMKYMDRINDCMAKVSEPDADCASIFKNISKGYFDEDNV